MNEKEKTVVSTTVSKDEWLATIKDIPISGIPDIESAFYDFQGVDYLDPIIEGYMTSPVALYDANCIAARTSKFTDISEVMSYMLNNGNRIIMYMLVFYPGKPIYSTMDATTFTPIPLDKPNVSSGHWIMRYATL